MRRRGLTIFWWQYFDLTRTRAMGRKIPKALATPKPTLEDLYTAAKALKYYVEIDPQSRYPKTWWDDPGRLLIDTMGQKKNFVLKRLAPEIKKAQKERHEKAALEQYKKKRKKNKKADQLRQTLKAKQYQQQKYKKNLKKNLKNQNKKGK